MSIRVESEVWGIWCGGKQGFGEGMSRVMVWCQVGESGPAAGWGQQAGALSAGGGGKVVGQQV